MRELITVFVVDGDESVRRAILRLMRADGFQAIGVESVDSLLLQEVPASGAVLLVDMKTARQGAESLQDLLNERGWNVPLIYLTDCDSERSRRQAKQQGAVGYLRKPVDEKALFDVITFSVQRESVIKSQATRRN